MLSTFPSGFLSMGNSPVSVEHAVEYDEIHYNHLRLIKKPMIEKGLPEREIPSCGENTGISRC
jgi:hypothetical protein